MNSGEKPPRTDDAISTASCMGSLSGKAFNSDENNTMSNEKSAVDKKQLETAMLSIGRDVPPTMETPLAAPGGSRESDLAKVSSTKDVGAELNRVMTSGEEFEYPTGAKLTLISFALCLAVFLMALDNTIIATAIPHITDRFHSLSDVGWYGSAYLLTTASFQLLYGKFYTYFSIKWVFLGAISVFELGSLICGIAPNSITLIIGRAVAGIGGAGIFSGALIIVAYSVPLAKRPMYTGLIGAMYGIASVAGPLLGGAFTIGAVTVLAIIIFFKPPQRAELANLGWRERVKEFDLYGTMALIPAIICVLLALQWGGTKYSWGNGRIIGLFVVFGVLIVVFIGIQFWKQDSATVPPSMLKRRSIAAAAWFSFSLGTGFFLLVYYLPIWFQAVKGASAVKSGIMNLPMILTMVVVSIISGMGVTAIGYYTPLMIASSFLTAVGIGLMCTFHPDTNHSMWIGYQAITGIGVGLGFQQPLIAVQTVLDISQVPLGTSLVAFVQTLGGALFVSVGQNVFSNRLVQDLAKYVPDVDPNIVLNTGATSIQQTISKADLPGVTLAYNNALTRSFLVACIMSALTILGAAAMEWRSVKGKKIEMTGA